MMPLLLIQNDDWHALSPILEEGEGLKDPKLPPLAITCKFPLNGNVPFTEETPNDAENENTFKRVPQLINTEAATDKPTPTPLAVRHATRVSLPHRLDAQAVFAIRTRLLQSERPPLAP